MTDSGTRDVLAAAIRKGEIVRIVYLGGTRPGSIRDVRPLWLASDFLRATDVAVGEDKTFVLAKIRLADGATVTALADAPKTVAEAIAPKVSALQGMGWHVDLTRDAARLRTYFKNGKPQKTDRVSLTFNEYTGIGVVDIDESGNGVLREESWKSRAPYHVSSRNGLSRSYGNIWKATALFLEEAIRLAPREADQGIKKDEEDRV